MPPFDTKANHRRKTKQTQKAVQKGKKIAIKKSDVENNRFDIIGNLPPEIVQIIFAELSPADLRNALGTCRKWKDLASDDYFWKLKCKSDNYLEMKETSRNKVYEKFVYNCANYWQRVYVYNEVLHQNWRDFTCKEMIAQFPVHTSQIHYFDDEIFIIMDMFKKIYVYNYCTRKLLQDFRVEMNGDIIDVIIRKTLSNVVYCHKEDQLLTVWSISSGLRLLNMAFPPESGLDDIVVYKNLIAVLFYNGVCQIVNILSGNIEYKTKVEDLDNCVCFYNDQVAFGNRIGVINVMNWEDKVITWRILCGAEIIIHKIKISFDYLIAFSSFDICIWSLKKKTKLRVVLQSNQLFMNQDSFFLNSNTLLVKNISENRLEALDLVNGICKFNIVTEASNISTVTIKMNDHYIITYGYPECNRTPKLEMWCKKTGKLITDISLNFNFTELLMTNTKLIYLKASRKYPSVHLHDFETKIKLNQLNSLFT